MQAMTQFYSFPNWPPLFKPFLGDISEDGFDDVNAHQWPTISTNICGQIEAALIDSINKVVNVTAVDSRIVDIDADVKDPLLCPDIAADVFHNLRLAEVSKRPRSTKHDVTDPKTRALCVDCLIDAADQLRYSPETLHLAVNYLDRYLSGNTVNDDELNLLSLTCLKIASKIEEVRPNHFDYDDYLGLGTNDGYYLEDFVRAERSITSYLEYDLTGPTACTFLGRYVRAAYLGGKKQLEGSMTIQSLEWMARYLAELSLLSHGMIGYLPSLVAASSVFLAHYILDPSERPWNHTVQHYTRYKPLDLRECVLELHALCYNMSSDDSVMDLIWTKYSDDEYGCVALKRPPPSIPPQVFNFI